MFFGLQFFKIIFFVFRKLLVPFNFFFKFLRVLHLCHRFCQSVNGGDRQKEN